MKYYSTISMLLLLVICCQQLHSQISVSEYPKEVRCKIEELALVPAVIATSMKGHIATQVSEQTFSGGCLGTLIRTYTFTDLEGNIATAEQFIYLQDNQPPSLSGVPSDIQTTSDTIPPPPLVVATDNSGRQYEVYLTESKTNEQLLRTWTCTDDCGNVAEGVQIIRLM